MAPKPDALPEPTMRPMNRMQLAKHLGLHPDTIRTWYRERGLGRKIGGRIYFDLAEIDPKLKKEGDH